MRKNFFQKLQKVKFNDILHIFLFIFAIVPSIIYKYTHEKFWLICEYEMEARDNAFYFYQYMINHHPEQKVIYAINPKSYDYKRVNDIGQIVKYGSLMHWILYLSADINISSQKGGKPNAAICYLLEVYGILKNKRVFLQHGIIKDDLPYVHYKNAKFSMFTTSTKQEYDYVSQHFGYPKGIVKQVGLCRFDDLIDTSNSEIILVMPTWREWIAHNDSENKQVEKTNDFKETEYYQKWNTLLNSKELQRILNEHNKILIFYPHRNMQPYLNNFIINNNRIKIANFPDYDVHELLKSSSLLLTDYSSVAMDFAYLNKPIIYYQFDYDKFRKHHMEEGYFSYQEDGFGEIEKEEKEIIKLIEEYIKNEYKVSKKYQERIDRFFDMIDNYNCERTYKEVLKLSDRN